jgi:hypothetical protein
MLKKELVIVMPLMEKPCTCTALVHVGCTEVLLAIP